MFAVNEGRSSEPSARPGDIEVALYRWLARNGRMDAGLAARELGLQRDELEAAVASLTALRLLRADPEDPTRFRPVDPDLVAAVVTTSMESAIHTQQRELHGIRERFANLRDHYRDSLRQLRPAAEVIPGPGEVRAALTLASQECAVEMLTSQPGGQRVPEVLREALPRDTAMLSRGIRIRTLYHHTARFNGPSQAYVATLSAHGAEYRTRHELFGRFIAFDRNLAFIPELGDTWGAVVIREPSIVSYLCDVFEQEWTQATPFSDAAADGLELVAKDINRTILRLMAAGVKDATIARRIGMSLRTARKHVADIMEMLGAESRFQAGVLAAQQGLLPQKPLDSASADEGLSGKWVPLSVRASAEEQRDDVLLDAEPQDVG
ncbi:MULTISPECIES: helix-turn-helix transcriptional regulator [unclassified Streptomyces]|uniref:helix-turn-helix transcriptional regulator n=1 Tax=unclassified Streptomyces TaxID=2593676 RepID=UPI0029AE31A4|nr:MULTISPECIES: helix-turn-helix transcriptional regulator [unclassified Streptomyces]MDX3771727.1 helix-turn-helix transcriptional regulator [Streptomyces sp. AK08-01B]MDX3821317.1 helix-turn-helix transcriptional regulator [Streptomyces sp. AK08-01A]